MKLQKEKGITLIALIVTIIILIILAGISISTLTGDNGIIDQAHTAKEDTEIASWEEQIDLAIIDAEKKHRDTTMENVIEELINKKVINDESQVDKDTGTITTNEPSYVLEDKLADYVVIYAENQLKAGDYVNYVDKNGETRLCCVLYDKSSGYGVQIKTMDTVEDVTLGYKDPTVTGSTNFEKSKNSYNNAIENLNNMAMKYLNTTYASDARCVGSVPDNKNLEADYYTSNSDSYISSYNGIFKGGDSNLRLDSDQMNSLGIRNINKSYWLASRYFGYGAISGQLDIHYISDLGDEKQGHIIVSVGSDGRKDGLTSSEGLRPIFILKYKTSKIIDGEGSKEKPYTLGI